MPLIDRSDLPNRPTIDRSVSVRGLLGGLWTLVLVVPMGLVRGTRWVWGQLRAGWYNLGKIADKFALDSVLPNAITGLINEFISLIPYAFGRGSKSRQIFSSATLVVLMVLATPFSAGLSLILAVPFLVTLFFGFARIFPAVDSRWESARDDAGIERNRDVPLWRSK